MPKPDYTTHKMDTGDVITCKYNGQWFDITPETSTLSFDTRELTLDRFILHLLMESDKVTHINAGTSQRSAAIDRLEASIKAREDYEVHKAEVQELAEKLKKASVHAKSPLADEGTYWTSMAREFLKL